MVAYCNEKSDYTNIIPGQFIDFIVSESKESAIPMSDWVNGHDFLHWMRVSFDSNKLMLRVGADEIGDAESALKNREYVYHALYRSGVKVLTRENRGEEWTEWTPKDFIG